MRKIMILLWLCAVMVVLFAAPLLQVSADEEAVIQLAILLDTSNSMDGLIGQAKSQLWKIVNEFAIAKKEGKTPELQLALYEYGNDAIPSDKGYVRQVLPLTTDLDKVSEELFALKTNGGSEFCGTVIKAAMEELKWNDSDKVLKLIFIAGNEPFTQGSVDYREACKAAIKKGITVNTIFCGPYAEGIDGKWQDSALLSDGKYINIDQNQKVVHIDAPQDKEIEKLGAELNNTYIPYGASAMEGKARQVAQDANALSAAPGSNLERQVTKAQSQYSNAYWDLVDAIKDGSVKLEDLKDEELPENMRKMSMDERKAHTEAKAKEREKVQDQINKLNEQRKEYIAQKQKGSAQSGEETLDSAMVKALREQFQKKGYDLEQPKEK